MKENSLKRNLILKSRNDITDVLRNGIRFEKDSLRIILLKKTEESNLRVAFLVSKKLGKKAVVRNKVKRWLREIFRQNKSKFPVSHHIIITVKTDYGQLNFKKIYNEFLEIITGEKYIHYNNKILPKDTFSD